MDTFKQKVLKNKNISIWGIGYLGYTAILRLQDSGFYSTVYDFNHERLDDLLNNRYPNKEQLNSWSKNGKIPSIDLEKTDVIKDYALLFNNNIHIVSFPNTETIDYIALANVFIENRDKLDNCLVVFQSAGVPNTIENEFCKLLEKENINIEISTVFRSDWTVEAFFSKDKIRRVSGSSESAINNTKIFINLLGLETIKLGTIKESEVYENTKNALSYTIVAFFNQLSLAYPDINIDELSTKLLKDINFNNLSLGVSSVDYKSEQSIENILLGSCGDFLSILKEANSTNISFLFYYVNLLKNKNITSVLILGLSSYNNMKDLRFSPSLILAEYLDKEGIKVYIHDDNFTKDELFNVLPNYEFVDINVESIKTDAVFVMSLSNQYKFLTQTKVDEIGLSKVKYLLDNTGFFKDFSYSEQTVYHKLCDGNLLKVIS